jgi:WD40 repeat protein
MSDRIGQQLGNYRLLQLVGHGGFADVYLGEHIYLGTYAAIKVLDTKLAQDEIIHFQQEARTIARLDHPHIVRILDFGVENNPPFLVMSYAPHGTLRQRHPKGTPVPLDTIVNYVKQIARALQYAHNEKLIHRDIKPENMLLGRNEEVLLSDFGLAVVAQSSSRNKIRDVSGTIVYMAPEQARGKPQPNSDQYSLAVVVYEWLCGIRPFDGTYEEVIVQHAFSSPPSLRERRTRLSPELEAVVMRALEKDPKQRFASVEDFAHALEQVYLTNRTAMTALSTEVTLAPTQTTAHTQTVTLSSPVSVYSTEKTANEAIYAIAWSPDRRRIAYGGHERVIEVRGTTTGASTLIYHGHTGSVTTIAWSPNGQHIASASLDRTIQVWNATTGEKITTYDGHTGMISALEWSPDSKYLASTSSGTDNSVHIWDAISKQDICIYRGHNYWVRALTWSQNGKALASGSWHEIQVWDWATGKKLFTYRGHSSWIRSVAWSPQGVRIASASEDSTIQIWEPLNKGHVIATYSGHDDLVHTVLWSPDGNKLASASKDKTVHIWDADNTAHAAIHHVRTTSTYTIAWLADSKHIVAASGNGAIQVWQTEEK